MAKTHASWLAFAFLAGCGTAAPVEMAPTAWEGAQLHLDAFGTLNGEKIQLKLTGADAMDTAKLWCIREYTVPAPNGMPDYSKGFNNEVQLYFPMTIAGATRLARIELKKHNFQADAPGTQVTVVPRDNAVTPTPTQMWFEWEWHALPVDMKLYGSDALDGAYTQGQFTGTPDATGLLIPDDSGVVGGFIKGNWSAGENMTISFSAQCLKNNVVQTM